MVSPAHFAMASTLRSGLPITESVFLVISLLLLKSPRFRNFQFYCGRVLTTKITKDTKGAKETPNFVIFVSFVVKIIICQFQSPPTQPPARFSCNRYSGRDCPPAPAEFHRAADAVCRPKAPWQ